MNLLDKLATVRRIARAVREDDYLSLILAPAEKIPPVPGAGYVYLIVNPEYPHKVKCGRSNDPARRCRDYLQAVDAYPWELAYSWRVSDMEAAEAEAHRALAPWNYGPPRRNGKPTETFRTNADHARPIVEAAIAKYFAG